MKSIKVLLKPVLVAGAIALGMGSAQAQQMMPQGMMPQGMMPQQMMPQGMMPQQMMPQQMMPQQMMPQQMMPQQMMPQGMMRQHMMPQQMNPMAMLQLTEEQKKQLMDIGKEAQTKSVELMKKLSESSQQLPKLMMDMSPDPKQIGDAYAKMFELQRQMIEGAVAIYNKQLAVFTEEQRKLWNSMRQRMQGVPAPAK